MRRGGSGTFVYFLSLSGSFVRMRLGERGKMGCLGVLMSFRQSSSSSCPLSFRRGDGGRLKPSENEELGGLPFFLSWDDFSGSLDVESPESELE